MSLNFHKKIKVVMVIAEYFGWMSCYKSIYDEFDSLKNKKLFEVDIVYTPNQGVDEKRDIELEKWKNNGLNIKKSDDYDIVKQSPDVILFYKPYDVQDIKWCAKEIYKVVKKIVYIPNSVNLRATDESLVYQNYNLPMHLLAWKILVNNKKYSELIDKYAYQKNNKLLIGHPEYDLKAENVSIEYIESVNNIKNVAGNKKIVFWNMKTDLLDSDENTMFLENGVKFVQNIIKRDDVLIIWRVSKEFIDAVESGKFANELRDAIKYGTEKQAIYLDFESSYWPAFLVSDILATDSEFVIERYVVKNKPIIHLTEDANSILNGVIYKAYSYEDFEEQLVALLENQDLLKECRNKYVNENYYLPSNDETVAARLINSIKGSFGL